MNMISTGTFLTEMNTSDEQSSLVEKLVSAWEKKEHETSQGWRSFFDGPVVGSMR